MKDDIYFWNFEKEPGKKVNNIYKNDKKVKPLVSIITSFYNGEEHFEQTINCVLNQTFPFWEWIIEDDGSTSEKSLKYLEEVKKIDSRIKVFHQKNGGLAKGRDGAISHTTTDLILPIDTDDLIEKTFIETLYFALLINPNATWAFTNSVGFGKWLYLSDYVFDSEKMKTENHITATALIRKADILKLNGYGVAKRFVNEDWHLWLRMLGKNMFPVQLTYYGFWYRRRKESLLTELNDEKSKTNNLRLQEIANVAKDIKNVVTPIYYENKINNLKDIATTKKIEFSLVYPKTYKNNILIIIKNTDVNFKLLKYVKKQNKTDNIFIISLGISNKSKYCFRQKLEEYAYIYDLSTFMGSDYYLSFVEYLEKSHNISKIIIDEDIANLWKIESKNQIQTSKIYQSTLYNMEILKYKLKNTLPIRAVRKLVRILKNSKK